MTEPERTPRRSLGRRVLLYAGAGCFLLVLLTALSVILLPRSQAFRQRVLAQVTSRVLGDFGIFVTARDFDLRLRHGHLTVKGLEIAAARGAAPFARIEEAETVIEVGALARHKLLVRSLSLTGVTLDFSAPLPRPRIAPSEPGSPPYSVSVGAFELREGQILNAPGPAFPNQWVEKAEATRISLKGSFENDTAPFSLHVTSFSLTGKEGLSLTATLNADGEISTRGPFRLEHLYVSNEAVDLTGELSGDFTKPAGISGQARLAITPKRLLPGLGVDGDFLATADWKGGERGGSYTLTASKVGAESLEKWMSPSAFRVLSARGTHFDLQSSGRVDLDWPAFLSGEAQLHWWRGEEPLAILSAEIPEAVKPEAATMLKTTLALLPAAPGQRNATAEIEFSRWEDLPRALIRKAEAKIAAPDLLDSVKELRTRWPDLVPEQALDPRLAGPLSATVEAAGPLGSPRLRSTGTFHPGSGGSATWDLAGRLSPREISGEVAVADLPLALVSPKAAGYLSGSADIRYAGGKPSGRIVARATDVCLEGAAECVERLELTASGSPQRLVIEKAQAETETLNLELTGSTTPLAPWTDTGLRGRVGFRLAALSPVEFEVQASDGVISAALVPIDERAGLFQASASLPLGTLKKAPLTRESAAFLPDGLPEGPLSVAVSASGMDSCALPELLERVFGAFQKPLPAAAATLGTLTTQVTGALSVAVDADLVNPDASRGKAVADGLTVEGPAGLLTTSTFAEITLENGELRLEPVHVIGPETEFSVSGRARLTPGLLSGKAVARAVESIDARVSGRLEARLLRPFLAGGVPSGQIELSAQASGPLDTLTGTLNARGKDFKIVWPRPYTTKLENVLVEATFGGNGLVVKSGTGSLNGGPVTLAGSITIEDGLDLRAAFSSVRYRLAYGFVSTLGGHLELYFPWEGRRRLSGQVAVERGLLERDIDLESELVRRLLAPPESRSAEPGLLDTLDLDIDVTSPSGVRIRNNLADLKATWDRIAVSGTAAEPVIRGRIEVEPGGRVYAYQQAFRIDRGALTYTGDAASDPQLEFVTTSSLDDPTIAQGDSRATFDQAPEARTDAANALAEGLATYFGERLTKGIGEALGGARILLRPVLVFGETDPGTRLTVSKDISKNVLFAVSLDLRNAQRQTYLVDLHGFKGLPSLTAQIFTKEDAVWGGTLQQSIRFGGTKTHDEVSPRLASIRFEGPKALITRSLKRTVRVGKGDPVPRELPFDLEIELGSHLRDRGYPEAEVRVTTAPAGKPNTVDMTVRITPGRKVRFDFTGQKPPRPSQAGISSLYMPGDDEEVSLSEMEAQTVRVFRSLGFAEPRVQIAVSDGEEDGVPVRVVRIESAPGRKAPIELVAFEGVTAEEAAFLEARFSGPSERLELASGGAGARRRVLSSLALLGRPAAGIQSITPENEGRLLRVVVDGGPHSTVSEVAIEGVDAGEASRLAAVSQLAAGAVARSDQIALGSLRIEEALKERGYLAARVKALLSPATPELVPPIRVRYSVDTGEPAILSAIRFEGRRYASRSYLERTAALEAGEAAVQRNLDAARSRLYGTTLFSSIRSELRPDGPGKAEAVFTLEERPRFSVAYGLRWASDEGFAGVVDLLDQNLLGRAITVGVRALYSQNHRSGRFYLASRNLLDTRLDLEGFLEIRRDFVDGLIDDTTEMTLQLSRPLGRGFIARVYGKYQKSHQFDEIPDPTLPIDVTIAFPYLGSQLIWDTRDDPLFTSKGFLATTDLQASGPFLSSDFAYFRVFGQLNVYQPLIKWKGGALLWAQSVRGGWAKPKEGQELTKDVLFLAGGDSSVRGYPLEGLGPYDPDFGYQGGSRLFVLNEELRFPIYSMVSGLVFLDVGSVWNEGQAMGDFLVKSTGIGLRGNTPLGILRGDLAFPLDRREGDPRIKFYLGFGNIF